MRKLPPDERIALYLIVRHTGLVMIQSYTTDHELVSHSLTWWIPRFLMARPIDWPVGVQDLGKYADPPDALKVVTRQEMEYSWKRNSEAARLGLQSLADHLSLVPGRKSVYWITQAFPPRLMNDMGKFAWDKTLTALNEANVAVNTVDSRGMYGGNIATGTIASMLEVTEATGGKAYFSRNDLDAAMAEGIAASRVSYTLGFYLPESERDREFHTLKVKLNRPGAQLFYRQGYYAGNTEMPSDKVDKGDLESALLNQVDATGVGITARVEPVKAGAGLRIRVQVDAATLSLKQKDGKSAGRVDEMLVEQDESGGTLARISDRKDFQVTAAERAHYDADGVSWLLSIPLKPGAVKILVIVRDSGSGRLGSLSIPLK
jgi:VWFA-related protein